MKVVLSDQAKAFVKARGGTLFVRAKNTRCCGGAIVVLTTSTSPPRDIENFARFGADDVDVYYQGSERGRPNQLVVELRGKIHPHLEAYKDGCVFPV